MDNDDGRLNIYIMTRDHQKKEEEASTEESFLKNHLAYRFHFHCWLCFAFNKMSPFLPQIDLKWK